MERPRSELSFVLCVLILPSLRMFVRAGSGTLFYSSQRKLESDNDSQGNRRSTRDIKKDKDAALASRVQRQKLRQ